MHSIEQASKATPAANKEIQSPAIPFKQTTDGVAMETTRESGSGRRDKQTEHAPLTIATLPPYKGIGWPNRGYKEKTERKEKERSSKGFVCFAEPEVCCRFVLSFTQKMNV